MITRIDSFEVYSGITTRGLTAIQSGGTTPATSTTVARTGSRSLNNGNDLRNGAFAVIPAQANVWQVFGFYFAVTPGSDMIICSFRDSGTIQVDVRLTSTRLLKVTRNGTQLAIGTTILTTGTWYHISFASVIDPTVGTYEVKLNGAVEITGTGANTRASANSSANQAALGGGGPAAAGQNYWDDWVIGDSTGTSNTSSVGDIKVEVIVPNGAGSSTQFTPNTGTNYQAVDETISDSDTTYVSSSTIGHKDMYAYGNLTTATGSVKAVQTVIHARKDDAGTRTIAPVLRPTTVDTDGTTVNLGDSYAFFTEIFETSPDTSTAWSISEVNGAEFGVKVVS